MEDFGWAENNLRVSSPYELQVLGVNVYFAPNIKTGRVVNLADGRVETFFEEKTRPEDGYYAEHQSLERYCRREGIPLSETNGQMSTLPRAGEAGDPLSHGESHRAA